MSWIDIGIVIRDNPTDSYGIATRRLFKRNVVGFTRCGEGPQGSRGCRSRRSAQRNRNKQSSDRIIEEPHYAPSRAKLQDPSRIVLRVQRLLSRDVIDVYRQFTEYVQEREWQLQAAETERIKMSFDEYRLFG
jgi:hypothetical protein